MGGGAQVERAGLGVAGVHRAVRLDAVVGVVLEDLRAVALRGVQRQPQRDALPDRVGEHERLEGRAALEAARAADGQVDLAVARQRLLGVAAVQGHRLDRTGPGLDDVHDSAGAELVVDGHGALNGLLGVVLDLRVQRGRNGQAAAEQPCLALLARLAQRRTHRGVLERAPDVVAEVRRLDLGVLAAADDRTDGEQRLLGGALLIRRGPALLLGDERQVAHPGQHGVAAHQQGGHDLRVLERLDRVEAAGRLDDARQRRALGQREVLDLLAEVEVGRGAHPVHAVAVVGDVEVALQDLVLGQLPLDRQGVPGLLELAVEGLLGRRLLAFLAAGRLQQGVLHVLLGQGRPALADAAGLHVLDRGAQGALVVHAVVRVEAAVLDGDDGLAGQLGDLLQGGLDPVLLVEHRDLGPVPGQDPAALVEVTVLEHGGQHEELVGAGLGRQAQAAHDREGRGGQQQPRQDAHEQGVDQPDGGRGVARHGSERTARLGDPSSRPEVHRMSGSP